MVIAMNNTLFVNEVFGPTFQGEGPSTGKRAHFLRLGLCNLHCSWCDTPYTWDWGGRSDAAKAGHGAWNKREEAVACEYDAVLTSLRMLGTAPLLVISGGEPLLQRRALHEFLNYQSHSTSYSEYEIETNGTISPGGLKHVHGLSFNVSPKLVGSGNNEAARRRWEVLTEFAHMPSARFKFVVCDEADLDEVVFLVDALGIDHSRVWLMPEGTNTNAIVWGMRDVAQSAINLAFNLSTRMHVLLWGNERGR